MERARKFLKLSIMDFCLILVKQASFLPSLPSRLLHSRGVLLKLFTWRVAPYDSELRAISTRMIFDAGGGIFRPTYLVNLFSKKVPGHLNPRTPKGKDLESFAFDQALLPLHCWNYFV